ncbi:hypothetical protein BU17DRAFT_64082 [Hysterangium stoloniferum]|nr:hypothetical protein BU17DRAFT_64082 [Hysterangium stoloniferum]
MSMSPPEFLAAATFFFWDYCLTFGDEASVEMLLIIRLHAFYGRPKVFLLALCVLFVAMHGAALVFLGVELSQIVLMPPPSDIPSKYLRIACMGVKIPRLFSYYWIVGLAYDSILFFLLIGMWVCKRLPTGMNGGGLVQVLVRDGAWAFFTVLGLAVLIRVASALLVCGKGAIALAWLHVSLGVVTLAYMVIRVHVSFSIYVVHIGSEAHQYRNTLNFTLYSSGAPNIA